MLEFPIKEIALFLEGEIVGNPDLKIRNIAKIEEAGEGDLTFIANPKYIKFGEITKASAIIVNDKFNTNRNDLSYIKVDDPYFAFLQILEKIDSISNPKTKLTGIHKTSVISDSAKIGENVYIGPFVVISDNCTIGDDSIIDAGTYLGKNVTIGNDVLIYPNVVIRENCKIGNNAILHSGIVIGSDGFGFAPRKDGTYKKIPQLGNVVIEDDVEIGANCAIDRATMGSTIVKNGTKLDNLVHVAHNVSIGENTVIAAQTGISGSTKLGSNCMIGGQVGFIGHIEIADKVSIGAQSGISKSIKNSGVFFGSPAKEHKEAFRIEGAIRQLPELLREFRELKIQVENLKNQK